MPQGTMAQNVADVLSGWMFATDGNYNNIQQLIAAYDGVTLEMEIEKYVRSIAVPSKEDRLTYRLVVVVLDSLNWTTFTQNLVAEFGE